MKYKPYRIKSYRIRPSPHDTNQPKYIAVEIFGKRVDDGIVAIREPHTKYWVLIDEPSGAVASFGIHRTFNDVVEHYEQVARPMINKIRRKQQWYKDQVKSFKLLVNKLKNN